MCAFAASCLKSQVCRGALKSTTAALGEIGVLCLKENIYWDQNHCDKATLGMKAWRWSQAEETKIQRQPQSVLDYKSAFGLLRLGSSLPISDRFARPVFIGRYMIGAGNQEKTNMSLVTVILHFACFNLFQQVVLLPWRFRKFRGISQLEQAVAFGECAFRQAWRSWSRY